MSVRCSLCMTSYILFAGEFNVHVESRCATQHITFSSQGAVAQPKPQPQLAQQQLPQQQLQQQHQYELSQGQQQQEQRQQQHQQVAVQAAAPVRFQLAIECLVLSVWDDERSRLLGVEAGTEAKHCSELCCFYWDGLTATCIRTPLTGDAYSSAMQPKQATLGPPAGVLIAMLEQRNKYHFKTKRAAAAVHADPHV